MASLRPHWQSALLVGVLLTATAEADILHLTSGGSVDGQIIEQTDAGYRVRTTVGVILVARDNVARIEPGPTPFDEYDRRLARTEEKADTPAGWFELAEWCGRHDLNAERRRHLERVIELDANHAAAREALGFVKVGDVWVDGRRATTRPAEPETPESLAAEQEREIRAMQGEWLQRINAIETTMLNSSIRRIRDRGRERILGITDPLAILPLTEALSAGNEWTRKLLVEVLGQFTEDEALLNLTAMSLVDSSRDVRRFALSKLARGGDPRVTQQIREALKSDSDVLIRNAAEALAVLRDPGAVPDLITVLTAERNKVVEIPVTRYFGAYPVAFGGATSISLGGNNLSVTPTLGVQKTRWAAGVHTTDRFVRRNVTVFRTAVLEALKAITGQNFGFDAAAWRRWYEEKGP